MTRDPAANGGKCRSAAYPVITRQQHLTGFITSRSKKYRHNGIKAKEEIRSMLMEVLYNLCEGLDYVDVLIIDFSVDHKEH